MAGKLKKNLTDERIDRLGHALVRASAANEAEAEAAASAPFLYARVRSRIAAERERRQEGERWLALLGIVWRAVPAMAAVAVLAFSLFLFASLGTGGGAVGFGDEALLGAGGAGIEHVVFADRRPMTNDEVLASIMNEEEREALR
ncbi:MAG: hypothetical protein ACRD9R_22440 [Pyrinomonadaceae bacterium]